MNKVLAFFTTLLMVSGLVEAHPHQEAGSLTHSLEHLSIAYTAWAPYVIGACLVLLAAILFWAWWIDRRSA